MSYPQGNSTTDPRPIVGSLRKLIPNGSFPFPMASRSSTLADRSNLCLRSVRTRRLLAQRVLWDFVGFTGI
jgi:hypothetical protein